MKKLYLLLAMMFVLMSICVSSSTDVFTATNASIYCTTNWVGNATNVHDNSFTTYDRFSSGDAFCYFNYTATNITAANLTYRGAGDSVGGKTIPFNSSCVNSSLLQTMVQSTAGSPYNFGVIWWCRNATAWVEMARSGSGVSDNWYVYEQTASITHSSSSPSNTTNCSDTDSQGFYPTLNYATKGTMTATGLTNRTDYCGSGTQLIEYSCDSSSEYTVTVTPFDCSSVGAVCINGACVQGNNCTTQTDTYSFPVIWRETFPYTDAITSHGWSGYPFLTGSTKYDQCNVLVYDNNVTNSPISYELDSPQRKDFKLQWDMFQESTDPNDPNSFIPCDNPVIMNVTNSSDGIVLQLMFAGDCNIYQANSTGDYGSDVVGTWTGGEMDTYLLLFNLTTETYSFYYTNISSPINFLTGTVNHALNMNTTDVNSITFYPDGLHNRYIDPNYSMWLDNIILTQTQGVVNVDTSNFCYFSGCLFFDHFAYTDSTSNHGWYLPSYTPINSVVVMNNNEGLGFEHAISIYRPSDGNKLISFQFKAYITDPDPVFVDDIEFIVYGVDSYQTIISDHPFQYGTGVWHTYTYVINTNTNKYDIYVDGNKRKTNQAISTPITEITKIGFRGSQNAPILWIDSVTVSVGNLITTDASITDTGINPDDLKSCWSKNGTYDWSCCDLEQQDEKNMWCPVKTTSTFVLGNIAVFILQNFIYFLIIVIIFVLALPIIIKSKGVN
jgi:hypothetical protein